MITFIKLIAIGGWTFTALTGFGGASGFCGWGCDRFLRFPIRWIPGEKFKANPETSSLAGRVDIRSRHTMVNIPWLTAYLLLVTVEGKAIKNRDPARSAKE